MSKELLLKKLLIKNAGIVAAVCAGFLTAAIFISNYNDTVQSEQSGKQGQNNSITAEIKDLETSLGIESQVVQYYDNYTKSHNDSFVINREIITNLLSELRKKHHLSNNIEVTVSPVSDVADNNFTLKSGKMIKSTVHITMGALTDNSVYNFIYDLQHKLPGIVLVSELKLTKKEELSRTNVLQAVNQHNIIPMVAGELTFVWVGIRPNAEGAGNAH